MKRLIQSYNIILLAFTFICIGMNTGYSQTIISGGVVSGTWASSGSPYQVQGAIMVADGTTLTIDPGVTVEFQGSYKFLIMGRLLAIGTVTDSIKFTATDTTAGWLGVRFDSTSTANDTSRFDFCDFRYGKANGNASITIGGGLYLNHFSKVVISNSTITNCVANTWGGGINCNFSNPKIINNLITNNMAEYGGGGIHLHNSSPVISDNLFSGNSTFIGNGRGAAICSYGNSIAMVSNNTFVGNVGYRGGAYFASGPGNAPNITSNIISDNVGSVCSGICGEASNSIITNNTFTNNNGTAIFCEGQQPLIAWNTISNTINGRTIICASNCTSTINQNILVSGTGGGIRGSNSTLTITNNFIANNHSPYVGGPWGNFNGYGGGISLDGGGVSVLKNNVLVNNSSDSLGGAIYLQNNNSTISNNTIANNYSLQGGGLVCAASSDPEIHNSILWGNTAVTGNQVYLFDEPSDPNIYFSDIQGGSNAFGINTNVFYLGTYSNNIDSDPLFQAPTPAAGSGFISLTQDWSPQAQSPCVNAGNPSGIYSGNDILGNPRVNSGIIDIGAIEVILSGINDLVAGTDHLLFPNPSPGIYYLKDNIAISNTIEIFTLNGELVSCQVNSNRIDITHLPYGIYFARILADNAVINIRVVKE